jgi:radical SAM superfamily enzyme YgiQ (UPF0313 family)
MRVALLTVYSHDACTLKDVAGGFGTVFRVGTSVGARLLERAKTRVASLPPSMLALVAAYARLAGHEVQVVEVRAPEGEAAARARATVDADVVVLCSSIVDAPAEREVAASLRGMGRRVIAVGAYATARPHEYDDVCDAVVRGEPEALGTSLFDATLEGVVDAGWVSDLDALPLPDWTAFDISRHRYAFLGPGPVLPVSSARGCAYGCGYCPWRVTAPFRQRAPAAVASEVAELARRHDVRAFAFRDPLFNLDRDRVLAIAGLLRPMNLRWSAEMRADRLDGDLLRALRDAGLRSLELGVESIDRQMLASEHRKPPKFEQIRAVVRDAQRLGIRVVANYMLGLPDDDEGKFRATVAFARELDAFAVQFTVATPYPGTALADRVAGRLRVVDPSKHTGWTPTFAHDHLSAERIEELREWAYLDYHYRVRYAVRFLRHAIPALVEEAADALRRALEARRGRVEATAPTEDPAPSLVPSRAAPAPRPPTAPRPEGHTPPTAAPPIAAPGIAKACTAAPTTATSPPSLRAIPDPAWHAERLSR